MMGKHYEKRRKNDFSVGEISLLKNFQQEMFRRLWRWKERIFFISV